MSRIDKDIKRIKALLKNKKVIWGIVGAAIVLIWLVSRFSKEAFYNDFDKAREESREEMDASLMYEMKDGDHVNSFNVKVLFDDDEYSSMSFHTNYDLVEFKMDATFDMLSLKERCRICNEIMEEVTPKLREYFKNTRYSKIFEANCSYSKTMKYRGKYLEVSHDYEFKFYDATNTYTFPKYNSMTVTLTGTSANTYYVFSYKDGKISDFGNRYAPTSGGGSSKTQSSGTSGKTKTSSGSSGKKKTTYDPYDGDKYKSGQDFADDKYEEFEDYEDDYDDEDEAYDAAEDYWDDNY
ncbi:hypothetical protein [Butyrivibrio proteoclasticus]|uniref:hypothetical protein n=1 Tax=Butyrivibrio proteoclasticus TaxID=43305 RepID=UPI00047E9E67|nr:hypothetical protein [Butyrivibrio proteoclasticus]